MIDYLDPMTAKSPFTEELTKKSFSGLTQVMAPARALGRAPAIAHVAQNATGHT
jgi:hypothetical protein